MHSLLKRQIRRYFGESFPTAEQLQTFIDSVNEAYLEFDTDREMLERTLDLSSQEMLQANSQLRRNVTDHKKAEEALRDSEERYRSILDNMEEAYFEVDLQGNLSFFNSTAVKNLGYTNEEMMGMSFKHFLDNENTSKVFEACNRVFLTGKAIRGFDWELINKNGEKMAVEASVALRRDNRGNAVGFKGVVRDVSLRKQAEEALLKSEERYRTILESIEEAYFELDLMGDFTFFNDFLCRSYGYSREELMGMNYKSYTTPETAKLARRIFNEIYLTGKPKNQVSYEIVRKDGTRMMVEMSIALMYDLSGEPVGFRGVGRDVTERIKAEQALKQSEEHFRSIFENTGNASILIAKDTTILLANSNFEQLAGYSKQEMEGKMSWTVFIADEDLEMMKSYHQKRRNEPGIAPTSYEFRFKNRTGELRYIFLTVSMIPGTNESVASCMDITERKRAENELRRSEERYRNILDSMEEAYYEVDLKGNATFLNSAAVKMIGYPEKELLNMNFRDVMEENIIQKLSEIFHQVYLTGEPTNVFDWELITKNGDKIIFEASTSLNRDASGNPIGFKGVGRDVTERKKAEKALRQAEEERKKLEIQLVQAQKMESIGTLAGGIAHDFNNILSAIIGYAQLAMNDVMEPDKAYGEINEVLKAGDRAKNLVSQILTFSRQTEIKQSPQALQSVIKESLKMLRSIIPSTIELRQNLEDSGLVMSDPTQINQVIMNLCTNAVSAMDKTGGILDVTIRRVSTNGNIEARDLDLTPGAYLKLSVSDTGHGMTPEVQARIFDPYFTTKGVGRGTGLGLAVVHGIVNSHGGTITCSSELGKGTTFDVYLPEIESGKEALNPFEKESLPRGTERILYIDDEQVLVDLAKKMMEKLGYTVFTRSSSIEALEFFRNNPDKFDLVITDMTMPGITGDNFAQKIMEIRHDIPVILCTGYSVHITEERAKGIGIREFIMKPLVMKELAKTIRKVLDER